MFASFNLSMATFGIVYYLSAALFLGVALTHLAVYHKANKETNPMDHVLAYASGIVILAFIPWANLLMTVLVILAPMITRFLARRAQLTYLDRVLRQRTLEDLMERHSA